MSITDKTLYFAKIYYGTNAFRSLSIYISFENIELKRVHEQLLYSDSWTNATRSECFQNYELFIECVKETIKKLNFDYTEPKQYRANGSYFWIKKFKTTNIKDMEQLAMILKHETFELFKNKLKEKLHSELL